MSILGLYVLGKAVQIIIVSGNVFVNCVRRIGVRSWSSVDAENRIERVCEALCSLSVCWSDYVWTQGDCRAYDSGRSL